MAFDNQHPDPSWVFLFQTWKTEKEKMNDMWKGRAWRTQNIRISIRLS